MHISKKKSALSFPITKTEDKLDNHKFRFFQKRTRFQHIVLTDFKEEKIRFGSYFKLNENEFKPKVTKSNKNYFIQWFHNLQLL